MSQIPSCLIIENHKGKIFIIDRGNPHQVEKILNSNVKINDQERNELTQQSSEQEEQEEIIVEEYLDDEEYLQEIISEEETNPVNQKTLGDKYDHSYADAQLSIDPIDGFIIEEVYESDQIKTKGNHKLKKLTGKAACKYCESLFKSKETLKKHECKYLQCDKKNFICKTCGKELSRKTFSNHLHETLNCQYCQKEFLNPRNLKKHLIKLHKNDDYVPPPSPSLEYYKKELQVVDVNDEFPAVKEKKKYPRKSGRFECDLCGRVLKTNRSLSQHLLLHSKNYQFICENCGEKFTTRTGINKHSCERKRRRPDKDFRTADVRHCKYCDLWFQTFEENKVHECVFQFQNDAKMFRCRFCQMEMAKNSFNKHMSKHTDPNEYLCSLCDKQLATEAALLNHLTVHSGDKPYKCTKCDKSFINKSLLTRHSRFHGNQIPIYKCDVCNREVASKYHLKTHQLTLHRDDVICQLCKESFSTKDLLKSHYKNEHEPHICRICGKKFSLKRYLKMHEKLHNEVTTQLFKCDFCSKSFSRRSIANHVFKIHQHSFEQWRDNNLDLI